MLNTKTLYHKLAEQGITIQRKPKLALKGVLDAGSPLVLIAKRRLPELVAYEDWLNDLRPTGIVEYRTTTGIVLIKLHSAHHEPPPITATHWRQSGYFGVGEWKQIKDGAWVGRFLPENKGKFPPKWEGKESPKWIGCEWGDV